MNKKIVSILLLLIVLVSVVLAINNMDSSSTEVDDDSLSDTTINDELSDEIDENFLDEDDEVDIGDMI